MTDIDKLIEDVKKRRYTNDVDIVDSVMKRIELLPQPQPLPNRNLWVRRIAYSAAAAIALAVAVNVFLYFNKDYKEPQLCSMIASVYDYNPYADSEESDMSYLALIADSE